MVVRLLLACALLATVSARSNAQSRSDPSEQQVRAAVEAYGKHFRECNVAGMNRLMADNFGIVGTGGVVLPRTFWLERLDLKKQQKPGVCDFDVVEIAPIQIKMLGKDAAMVVSNYEHSASGRRVGSQILTLVFARQNGEWRAVEHISTVVTPPNTRSAAAGAAK